MSTAARVFESNDDYQDPNAVKVVINQAGRAMYFSRAPIPYSPSNLGACPKGLAMHHLGIYAYRVGFLKTYHLLPVSALEQCESLEQLRVLDNGGLIAVYATDLDVGFGVDTPDDLKRARAIFAERNL